MSLSLKENCLGVEIHANGRLHALYRVAEELERSESPKPCFAPLYTPSGILVTEYRPADHLWHTGLYYGWVHANDSNLWGGPWYLTDKGKYEKVPDSHGIQRHDAFSALDSDGDGVHIAEDLTWLDAADQPLATETRSYRIEAVDGGLFWHIQTSIRPSVNTLTLGASRAARYSGLELRMGPPFADASHSDSEGRQGHENIMGQTARWVAAAGAAGGAVVMMDYPSNPRHPVTWFTRKNLLGAGLLMTDDLTVTRGESLDLTYGFWVLDALPEAGRIEARYAEFAV